MPRAPQRSQFGDPALTNAEALSACGPAAAIAFARVNGRNPTLREAVDLAKSVGWSADAGMAGPASERALLAKLGISADLTPSADWSRVRADVSAGKPVIISTPRHYFTVSDVDPTTGKFYVGSSGTDLRGGSEWMTADEIASAGRGVNGALHMTSAPVDAPAPPPPPPVPAERQRFLEANDPGGSAAPASAGPSAPASPQASAGTTSPAPARSPLDDVVTPDQPDPVPDMLGRPTTRAASTVPGLDDRAMADLFAQRLLGQIGGLGGGMPSIYRLPGPELPGFRPTRFALPMGV